MDPITPVHGTTLLLIIAAAAVALLLFLIIRVRLHAFIALVLVSVVTAVAAGIPLVDVPNALLSGFGSTLGSVALLVGFGVMLGRLLEVTGGAQVLADTLIGRFGEKRAPFALGVAALLFGFPIFFDAGLVVFLPIIITVARRFGGSVLYYALPAAGAFAAMHALVPPHPGPVAAAEFFDGDIGTILLINLPVAVVSWYVGVYLLSRLLGRRVHVDVPELVFGPVSGAGGGTATAVAESPGTEPAAEPRVATPSFGLVLGLLLLPLVLIAGNTVVSTLASAGAVDGDATWVSVLQLLGNTPIALLITLLVAIWLLGTRGGRTLDETSTLLDQSLAPICSIILITGAGGMFGGVLRTSGIGESLTSSLSDLGLPDPPPGVRDRHDPPRRPGVGDGVAHHHRGADLRPGARRRLRRRPDRCARHRDRRRRHRALARQRLGLLAGEPLLRDGRGHHAQDLDGHGDHAGALGVRAVRPRVDRGLTGGLPRGHRASGRRGDGGLGHREVLGRRPARRAP